MSVRDERRQNGTNTAAIKPLRLWRSLNPLFQIERARELFPLSGASCFEQESQS
jgi:hypothetical protein